MTGSRLLALDLGTTGVRALLVDGEGKVLARAYRPLATRFPEPGRVEQDPEEMWQRSVEVLREARLPSRCRGCRGARCRDAALHAVAWDAASGAALCPALGWQDKRTQARADELRERGIPITTLPSATRFEWWLRHEPAVQQAARAGRLCFGGPDTWLTYRLTGGAAHVTDPSQASCTGFYDLRAGRWNPDVLAFFSVEERTLPSVVPTASVVGETPRELLGSPLPVAPERATSRPRPLPRVPWLPAKRSSPSAPRQCSTSTWETLQYSRVPVCSRSRSGAWAGVTPSASRAA